MICYIQYIVGTLLNLFKHVIIILNVDMKMFIPIILLNI